MNPALIDGLRASAEYKIRTAHNLERCFSHWRLGQAGCHAPPRINAPPPNVALASHPLLLSVPRFMNPHVHKPDDRSCACCRSYPYNPARPNFTDLRASDTAMQRYSVSLIRRVGFNLG